MYLWLIAGVVIGMIVVTIILSLAWKDVGTLMRDVSVPGQTSFYITSSPEQTKKIPTKGFVRFRVKEVRLNLRDEDLEEMTR